MIYIKTFEGYFGGTPFDKFYFYDKDGKWFSTGKYTKSINNIV